MTRPSFTSDDMLPDDTTRVDVVISGDTYYRVAIHLVRNGKVIATVPITDNVGYRPNPS